MVRASDLRSTNREFDSRPCAARLILRWVTISVPLGKPSWYVTGHLSQLSLLSIPPGIGKSSTGFCLGLRWGVFTCVGTVGW